MRYATSQNNAINLIANIKAGASRWRKYATTRRHLSEAGEQNQFNDQCRCYMCFEKFSTLIGLVFIVLLLEAGGVKITTIIPYFTTFIHALFRLRKKKQ